MLIRFSRRPFQVAPLLAIKLINRNLRIGLDKHYSQVCNRNEWHKVNVTFFAPVSRISRTDDRTKENIHERKRIAIAHAKFVLAENTHYFAHFPHNGFGNALLARNYCAYNGMAFRTSDNVYNGVIMARHYCAYNDMAFVSRNTRYDAGDFGVSLLRLW